MDSPCIQVCKIDFTTGLCEGCYRTRDEIALWSSLTTTERLKIMSQLKARAPRK